MKNLTPRKVAIAGALGLAVLLFLSYLILVALFPENGHWDRYDGLILSLIAGFLAYFLFYYLIRRYLQEKLKLIHRTVQGLKLKGSGPEDPDMDEDVLGDLHQQVQEKAEAQSEEIRRLKEQEAFRRRFVGNVAHELKTPVFSIQGHILTLLEGALEDPEINRKFLERASKSVDRMTRIIEDLDTITQFESGRLEVQKGVEDPRQVASDVMETLELKAQKKGIRLRLRDPKGKVPKVLMDRQRIEQVFSNLIANAIDHGSEGGYVEVAFYDMEEYVLVEVSDDGVGIAKKDLPRIFQRFYRVDKGRSREHGGTGLGLSIVKHIMEAHGQNIDVRSEEGVGTTFSFTLEKA
jgi:two-component system phosphate regulon sensor histidine kinase PhoR